MNLNAIAQGPVAAINPQICSVVQISTGYLTLPDGTRQPTYQTFTNVPIQVQALSYGDLMKLDGLNIQGIRRACYVNGNVEGLDRASVKGGDLIQMPPTSNFPGPTTWLVVHQLEHWDEGWSKFAITLQVGN